MSEPANNAGADQSRATWYRGTLDALVLAFTLACGIAATWYAYSAAETTRTRQRQEQFNAAAQSVVDSFYLDLVRSVEVVRATGLMVANQKVLTHDEFQGFAQGIMANAPALTSLQWQPVVRGVDLGRFEAEAHRDGMPGYRVVQIQEGSAVPVRPQAQHVPILYAFPESSAQLGLDLAQVPQRMASKLLARDTGQPVASGSFPLISRVDNAVPANGIVISSAVLNPAPAQANAESAKGYAAGVIQLESLFREAAFRAEAASMDMMVFDQASEPAKLVYSALAEPEKVADSIADKSEGTAFDVRLTIDVASRPWEVVLRPRAHLLSSQSRGNSQLALWGGGGATVLLLMAMFITQRSRHTAARSQANSMAAEQRLSRIIEGTQAGTWEWHVPSGRRVINEHWAAMLGYTGDELDGTDNEGWLRLLHPDDRKVTSERMAAHLRGETPHYECELRVRHKLGHWVWVSSRAGIVSRTADGKPEWVAGTHLDISESKRLVQQISDVRTALDAHAIVGITDASGAITYANDKFCEVSQYSRAELLGRDHRILNSGQHAPEFFTELWDTIAHGHTWRGEIRNRSKDGRFYWVDTTIAPILDEAGLPKQYIAIRYDITSQKESAVKLEAAKESAEAASRAKSEFLATMSHEIRTPMNGILGMLKLLQHTDLTTRQLDYTRKADGATQALLGIVNDILDFSKVEAGKLELDPTDFVLGDVLRDLSVVLSANLGNKEIEVLFSVDTRVPKHLWGDALRLRQVLLNLTGNAIKFTESGHVLVSLKVVSTAAHQVAVEFSVQDSGIGIAIDKLVYIFEGFSQAESTTTRRFGGTGLGLAISKRLVAAMGGNLQVESQPGVGSRFFFTLQFPVPEVEPNRDIGMNTGAASLRVLVVDDSAMSREVLLGMVTAMGWQGTCLEGGEAALSLLADASTPPFNLVLMDWRMPGLDGWETTRRIRQLQTGGQASVVIMVTAAGREALSAKPKSETDMLDGYLVKPVTASMLFDAVTEATANRSGQPAGEVRHRYPNEALHRLEGLRLLVVEDNLLNQQIAQELLERNGAIVEIAGGGIDGVAQALAAEPPFDAILMDMQMPDIDGLEATRRIREMERMRCVPIIAMTANAMQSDKEACLAAGMVDHVGKPIDLEVLITTILRHTRTRTQESIGQLASDAIIVEPKGAEAAEVVIQGEAPLVDLHAAVQRLGGNRAFFDKIALAFRTDGAAQLAAIQKQLTAGDKTGALRSIHTLKGLAGTVGASALAQLAAQSELELKALDIPEADGTSRGRELLQTMQGHFALVLDELNALIPTTTQTPLSTANQNGAPNAKMYAEQLQSLLKLLKSGNMRANTVCGDIRRDFAPHLDSRFNALEDAVNRLDFTDALARCSDLLQALG